MIRQLILLIGVLACGRGLSDAATIKVRSTDPTSSLSIEPTNSTAFYSDAFEIVIQGESDSSSMTYSAYVSPLTVDASRTDNTNVTYSGILVPYTANSSATLNQNSVAFISCDDSVASSLAVMQAVLANPACILLYSSTAKTCQFTRSYRLYNSDLGAIFSTLSASVSRQIVSSSRDNSTLHAYFVVNQTDILDTINTATSTAIETAFATTTVVSTKTAVPFFIPAVSVTTSSSPGWAAATSAGGAANGDVRLGSSTPSVAMIVLYSVTGLVCGFFLLIIILGAIRAHRHPERYQVGTTPDGVVYRRNRARGLARAVLDSIPLVKVPQPHERTHHHRHSNDTAADAANETDVNIKMAQLNPQTGREITANESKDEDAQTTTTPGVTENLTDQGESIDSGSTVSLPASLIETDGCPICFEPFLPGQNLRVLPCHHGFHAACVDQWLLNSSSQCPLCRVDLNLRVGEAMPEMPPGLYPGGNALTSPPASSGLTGLQGRLNRFLDTWNAQFLPGDQRRVALGRLREEERARQEIRRRRAEHLSSETNGPRTWHRFVERRRRLFHFQQQQQQQRTASESTQPDGTQPSGNVNEVD